MRGIRSLLITTFGLVGARAGHHSNLRRNGGASGMAAGQHQEQTVGAAFFGAGSLVYYYIGVMKKLQDLGVVVPGVSKVGGISDGAMIATMTCANVSMDELWQDLQRVPKMCEVNATSMAECFSNPMAPLAHAAYDPNITPQMVQRCGKGLVTMGVTELNPLSTGLFHDMKAKALDHFDSVDDMKSALFASNYVSCTMGPSPYTIHRGVPMVDGGYAGSFKDICPKGVGKCIKVDCFMLGDNLVDPPRIPPTMTPLVATPWVQAFSKPQWRLPRNCSSDLLDPHNFRFPMDADIHPGKYTAFPFTRDGWMALAWSPLVPFDTQKTMVEIGMADAQAWYDTEYENFML